MADGKINERILKALREKSAKNENVGKFLMGLIYYEADHPRNFMKYYVEQIETYSRR